MHQGFCQENNAKSRDKPPQPSVLLPPLFDALHISSIQLLPIGNMRLSRSFVVRSMLGRIAAMNTKFQFNLLDLPNELIVLVFEQLDDQKTIRNLCRTCRRVQELAEPILYRAALMRSGYAMDRYFDSLEKKKSRMHAVHGLDLALDPDYAQSFPLISRILCATKNLKRLFIESPQCNSTDFEDDESWEHMARWLLNPFSYNPSTEGARSLQNLQERKYICS